MLETCTFRLRSQQGRPSLRLLARLGRGFEKCTKRSTHHSASALHIVLAFLFIEFTLLFGSRILILLVLRDQIIHVTFCFGELHFVHALSSVPMKKSFAAEHCCKVF